MHRLSQEELPYHICDTIDQQGLDYFFQTGKGKYKQILVIGESPALNGRVLSGRAFYTKEGKLVPSGTRFNALFERFGFGVEDVSFTELCKCILGTRRELLVSCSPKCRKHLLTQIKNCKPKLIIVLGKHTLGILENMAGLKIPMGVISEQKIAGDTYTILPIYHPSPINPKSKARNEKIVAEHEDDIKRICS